MKMNTFLLLTSNHRNILLWLPWELIEVDELRVCMGIKPNVNLIDLKIARLYIYIYLLDDKVWYISFCLI